MWCIARETQDETDSLKHHGILGMKWGVRRWQNKDGTLTKAGIDHYRKLESQAIEDNYNKQRRNGGSYVFKEDRRSTGKNYDAAVEKFKKSFENDPEYRELSKKAFDAEKKRLMAEKKYIDDEEAYLKYLDSGEAQELMWDSIEASEAKSDYMYKKAEEYLDIVREAKLDDLGITENRQEVKKYLSDKWDGYYWDGNLDYGDDNYYDDWVEKEKFK